MLGVGAILAAVPATLVALTQGPAQAGMVLLMYMGVHFIEGYFITPLVQAAHHLASDGPNQLPRQGQRGFWRICLDGLRDPMLAMLVVAMQVVAGLVVAGLIYLTLGTMREALILLVFALLSIAITVLQETRTEHALAGSDV